MEKVEILKLFADETRLGIIKELLEEKDMCVCEIEKKCGIKQANASKHLKKLKDYGVVVSRREGNMVRHEISAIFYEENSKLMEYIK